MNQRELIKFIYDLIEKYVPENGHIFNMSVDFIQTNKLAINGRVEYRHIGHKTSVLDVVVFDEDGQPVGKALVTILMISTKE